MDLNEINRNLSGLLEVLELERANSKKLRDENSALRSYWRARDITNNAESVEELNHAFETLVFRNLTLEEDLKLLQTSTSSDIDSEQNADSQQLFILLQIERASVKKLVENHDDLQRENEANLHILKEARVKVENVLVENNKLRETSSYAKKRLESLKGDYENLKGRLDEAKKLGVNEREMRLRFQLEFGAEKDKGVKLLEACKGLKRQISDGERESERQKTKQANLVKIKLHQAKVEGERFAKRNEELEERMKRFGEVKEREKQKEIQALNERIVHFEELAHSAKEAVETQKVDIEDLIASQEAITQEASDKLEMVVGENVALEGRCFELEAHKANCDGNHANHGQIHIQYHGKTKKSNGKVVETRIPLLSVR